MPARREHAPDLPVAPFHQHDLQPHILSAAADDPHGFRRQPLALVRDAHAQTFERR